MSDPSKAESRRDLRFASASIRFFLSVLVSVGGACRSAAPSRPTAVSGPVSGSIAPSPAPPVGVHPLIRLDDVDTFEDHAVPSAGDAVERLFLGPLRAERRDGALRVAPEALAGTIRGVHRCGERWVHELDQGRFRISDTYLGPSRDLTAATRFVEVTIGEPQAIDAARWAGRVDGDAVFFEPETRYAYAVDCATGERRAIAPEADAPLEGVAASPGDGVAALTVGGRLYHAANARAPMRRVDARHDLTGVYAYPGSIVVASELGDHRLTGGRLRGPLPREEDASECDPAPCRAPTYAILGWLWVNHPLSIVAQASSGGLHIAGDDLFVAHGDLTRIDARGATELSAFGDFGRCHGPEPFDRGIRVECEDEALVHVDRSGTAVPIDAPADLGRIVFDPGSPAIAWLGGCDDPHTAGLCLRPEPGRGVELPIPVDEVVAVRGERALVRTDEMELEWVLADATRRGVGAIDAPTVTDDGVVYGVVEGGLVASWDGGAAREVALPEGIVRVGIAHRELAVATARDGRTWISIDQGGTWTDTNGSVARSSIEGQRPESLPCSAHGCVAGSMWIGAASPRASAATLPVQLLPESRPETVRLPELGLECEREPGAEPSTSPFVDGADGRFGRHEAFVVVEPSEQGGHRLVLHGVDAAGPFEYAAPWSASEGRTELFPVEVGRHAAVIRESTGSGTGYLFVRASSAARRISFGALEARQPLVLSVLFSADGGTHLLVLEEDAADRVHYGVLRGTRFSRTRTLPFEAIRAHRLGVDERGAPVVHVRSSYAEAWMLSPSSGASRRLPYGHAHVCEPDAGGATLDVPFAPAALPASNELFQFARVAGQRFPPTGGTVRLALGGAEGACVRSIVATREQSLRWLVARPGRVLAGFEDDGARRTAIRCVLLGE